MDVQSFLHDHPGFNILDELTITSCEAKITETYSYTGFYPSGKIKTHVETVSFGDFNTNTLRYELVSPSGLTHSTGGYIVTLDSANNRSAVQVELIDVKGNSKLKTSGKSFGAYISDSISGRRFGAALKHAVVLCGGKPSPF